MKKDKKKAEQLQEVAEEMKEGVKVQEPAEEQKEDERTEFQEKKSVPARVPPKIRKNIPPIPSFRDEVTVRIEKILEDGLNDSFQRLSPIAKQEFKLKGERTALEIRELLKSAHVKVKKILRLILDWLRMLPGVNRFFLEQEAKIKTDKIMALKNRPEN